MIHVSKYIGVLRAVNQRGYDAFWEMTIRLMVITMYVEKWQLG